MDRTHVVYRCFADNGRLLYVGQTSDLARRRYNLKRCAWWPDVAAVIPTKPMTARAALRYERIAIATENPRHNIQHHNLRGLWRIALGPSGRLKPQHLKYLAWHVIDDELLAAERTEAAS